MVKLLSERHIFEWELNLTTTIGEWRGCSLQIALGSDKPFKRRISMVFLYALESIFIAVFIITLTTQIIVPMLNDEPKWPWFRWRRIRNYRASIKDAIAQAEAEGKIREAEQRYDQMRSKGEEKNDAKSD